MEQREGGRIRNGLQVWLAKRSAFSMVGWSHLVPRSFRAPRSHPRSLSNMESPMGNECLLRHSANPVRSNAYHFIGPLWKEKHNGSLHLFRAITLPRFFPRCKVGSGPSYPRVRASRRAAGGGRGHWSLLSVRRVWDCRFSYVHSMPDCGWIHKPQRGARRRSPT